MRCPSCYGDIDAAFDKRMAKEVPALIRGYAARGRILATLSAETVEALEEFAVRIEQGEPVS